MARQQLMAFAILGVCGAAACAPPPTERRAAEAQAAATPSASAAAAPGAAAPATTAAPKPADEPYTPGLGEIMTLQQMRHAKLWLAGDAGNWPLAAYELDELGEGFADAAHFHPTHKDAPVPIDQAITKIMTQPLKDAEAAVGAQDRARFVTAFDAVTDGCNACHRATNFAFNVVTKPTSNPYANQAFAPARHP